jgi:chorismate lyase/3-hydroxybenzoate synthase
MFRARQPDFLPAAPALSAQYVPVSASRSLDRERLLAVIDYHALNRTSGDLPIIRVSVPQFNEEPLLEAWFARAPITRGEENGVHYAASSNVLMGYVETEAVLLDTPTYHAMSSILGLLREKGYPHLLRIWNYFPGINEDDMRLERYKRFCVGRHRAFFEHNPEFTPSLPAASAVGSKAGHLLIYFLAAKTPGIPQENPRQLAAYRYPPQYAPKSPAFARGMLATLTGEAQLFISGTASIVGHQSMHLNDVAAQLEETVANVDALIAAAAERQNIERPRLDLLKVYLRRAQDYPMVRDRLSQTMGEGFPILYLQAEICRSDLLLEIEGIAGTGG